jgi:hypothetical protein
MPVPISTPKDKVTREKLVIPKWQRENGMLVIQLAFDLYNSDHNLAPSFFPSALGLCD